MLVQLRVDPGGHEHAVLRSGGVLAGGGQVGGELPRELDLVPNGAVLVEGPVEGVLVVDLVCRGGGGDSAGGATQFACEARASWSRGCWAAPGGVLCSGEAAERLLTTVETKERTRRRERRTSECPFRYSTCFQSRPASSSCMQTAFLSSTASPAGQCREEQEGRDDYFPGPL